MKLLIRWSPSILVMAAIFLFSHRTGDDLNSLLPFFQKWVPWMEGFDWGHFIAYFVLSLTYLWALSGPRPGPGVMISVLLLCLVYGATDEYHQTFVEGRMADWKDLRNDGIGAAAALLMVSLPGMSRLYSKLPHAKKY